MDASHVPINSQRLHLLLAESVRVCLRRVPGLGPTPLTCQRPQLDNTGVNGGPMGEEQMLPEQPVATASQLVSKGQEPAFARSRPVPQSGVMSGGRLGV